ncbi:TetR/AcrR family transcriptional regulator [Novosphingobium sp.]|uniref:TetR/AcrR family transcriptional regulator n=1 Tax=Novosphingobium sp. TaxID=1874826 RepID=UPI003D115D39
MKGQTRQAGPASPPSASVETHPAPTAMRGPTQQRSVASLHRMIGTARELMLERGNEDFTLQDVSQRGKVSIGSIYHRFESKEALVRSVIGAELGRMGAGEVDMIRAALAVSQTLANYVPRYVAGFAEGLRDNSVMMRLAMQRASFDREVSGTGEARELEASNTATIALLTYRSEIRGDCETKARIAFQVIFATIARRLSLDTSDPFSSKQDWALLIAELSAMTLGYLITQPPLRQAD